MSTEANQTTQPFQLPPLPYQESALEPHITEKTFSFHYQKHHNAYVTNLNNLLKDTSLSSLTLENVIKQTRGDASKIGIFNNAAQVWNHTFFWNSMSPNGGGQPSHSFTNEINRSFGSLDEFKQQFKAAATTQFGSGWVWLIKDKQNKLKITKTPNADTPISQEGTPLIVLDVWEHAYYLDFQNRRPDYIQAFLNNLINWSFAEKNFS